jgi:hypothetical protein
MLSTLFFYLSPFFLVTILATSYQYMIVNSLALDIRETKKRVIPSQKKSLFA